MNNTDPVEDPKTENDPWEITPEREKARDEFSKKWKAKDDEMRNATPVHPETGELGAFVKYVLTGRGLRPLYRTPAGKEFLVPVIIK